MDSYRQAFLLRLQDNDFEPDETQTNWTGNVTVEWDDTETGEAQMAEHTVIIHLAEGFPYRAPVIYSKDDPPLRASWHLNPGDPPSLCLWDSERGWQPDFTAHKLLNRIQDWFYHYHTDNWPLNSQVPDLHLYLDRIGTVVIGEEWRPYSDTNTGQFGLWRPKFHSSLYIASCNGEHNKPEPRLAGGLLLGSNPVSMRGAWFQVPQPFVPPNGLEALLHQVDVLLKECSGWSAKNCIAAVGQKIVGGFPIAIGYPDNLGENRWLFLWARSPAGNKKRYNWLPGYKMRQMVIDSFQTAPAGKDALLKRSAFISKSVTCRQIILFGIGALGSSIALLLAKAGVGKLRFIDSDYLMPVNVMRHACGLEYVGFAKTTALQRTIQQHNPDCLVDSFGATWNRKKVQDYVSGYDLIVDATGNTNFSRYLNEICVERSQPVLFATAYRKARIGRIVMRLNGEAPCLECYLGHPEEWSSAAYPIIPLNPNESFIEDGCGTITEEAIALDVEAVANFTAREIIKFLSGDHGGYNLAVTVNEPLPDANRELFHTASIHLWSNKRYSGCSICGR
jgi:molybdopterin/thiamine biosynthesis adenylyltransferase